MSKERDYIENIEGAERRFIQNPVTIEKRVADDKNEDGLFDIEGYAFKFNTRANLGWFEEEILSESAEDERLLDDIRCLFNHSPNMILARSKEGKGTLKLEFDELGLKYSYKTPNRTYALDLQDSIDKGDVDQSSFAFLTREDKWIERDNDIPLRQITKFKKFFDVAPVTYPAYPDATVAKRSLATFKKEDPKEDNASAEANTDKNKRASRSLDVFRAQSIVNQNR